MRIASKYNDKKYYYAETMQKHTPNLSRQLTDGNIGDDVKGSAIGSADKTVWFWQTTSLTSTYKLNGGWWIGIIVMMKMSTFSYEY